MELFETLSRLTAAHGVSGREEEVRALLAQLAQPYCDEVRTDVMGNLICRKVGEGPRVMLSAHMDTAGLVVSHIQEEGYLRFSSVGGLTARQLRGQSVRFANGITGVVDAATEKGEKELTPADLYLDIGADSRSEAEKLVFLGDTAAFHVPARQQGERVLSSGLDDRAGCLALLLVMEALKSAPNDLYFVFTAQSRVGLRGVQTAAYAVDPAWAVVVSATAADDTPQADHRGSCALGRGAGVKVMDGSVICHPRAVELLDRLAEKHEIPVQHEVYKAGRSDAGAVYTTRVGVITGGVSFPVRHLGAPVEIADLNDLRRCVQLLQVFAESELPNL